MLTMPPAHLSLLHQTCREELAAPQLRLSTIYRLHQSPYLDLTRRKRDGGLLSLRSNSHPANFEKWLRKGTSKASKPSIQRESIGPTSQRAIYGRELRKTIRSQTPATTTTTTRKKKKKKMMMMAATM